MAETRRIGNFELLDKIGQGGMGAVFKARQISMDRVVALKVLPPSLAKQQKFIERFVREARASARLNHPNIVNGIDVGHDGKLYYFAMEYIEGQSLKDRIGKGRLSEEESIPIAKAMALALAHAHAHNILHRDIKPDNILIDNHGTPKLCDLGLARLDNDAESEKALTQQGQAVGTPHYISPEQARGEQNLDAKTDLYSLGATLYHMLTGVTMFEGSTSVLVMTKHITEKAPSPAEHGVQLSKNFMAVLAKLLVKDRNERYASAATLGEDLDRLLEGKPPLHAELPSNKWPFTGASISSGANTRRPMAAASSTSAAEKVRHPRRETRHVPAPSMGKFVPAGIAGIVIIAAAWYFTGMNKRSPEPAEEVAIAATPPKDVVVPVAAPGASSVNAAKSVDPAPPVRVAPQAGPLGFKKPIDINARVAPKAESVGFKAPPVLVQSNPSVKPPAAAVNSGSPEVPPVVSDVAVKTPEPVPVVPVPEKVAPPVEIQRPQKIAPGPELAGLMAKAVQFSAETRYRDAADLFKLKPDKLKALDDFDRALVEIHAAGYGALAELKPTVNERLMSNPAKLDAAKVFTKKLGGKLVGGDEKSLFIKDQQVDLKYEWQRLSIDELLGLTTQALGAIPAEISLGLGVLGYDQGDDTFARKMLGPLGLAHAKKILEVIDFRDKALIAKKIAETSAHAEKLMADVDIAMASANFSAVSTKVGMLRAKYGDVEKVKLRAAELDMMADLARVAEKTGAAIDDGNVALGENGALAAGTTPELIDGISNRYTGGSGFSSCPAGSEFTITLAKTYILRELRLLFWDIQEVRYYQFKLLASADGLNFAPLADFSRGEYKSWQTISFNPRPVKVLKFMGVNGSGKNGLHIVEFEAYCKPPDKPVAPAWPSVPAPGDGVVKASK